MTLFKNRFFQTDFPLRSLLFILLIALIGRVLLLASGTVSFHADEAVVGLMARHILQGERPTFFYGQPYMGSLDGWLIATSFRLLGDSLLTMRVVESILYLVIVALGFGLAWRLSGRRVVAVVAGLVLAVPPANFTLYSTATLGGYNETLVFGTLLLWLGYDVTHEYVSSLPRWALLGLIGGLAWWTNGLIAVYALPVALLILIIMFRQRLLRPMIPLLALALIAFFIGSAPWWVFDFTHNHAALGMYLGRPQTGEFAGIGIKYVPPLDRTLGLFIIGIPSLIGLHFPWTADYFLLPVGLLVLLVNLAAIYSLLRRSNPLTPDARALVLGMLSLFCLIFIASTFGADPTGRYFVPLTLPLGIVLGAFIDTLIAPSVDQPMTTFRRLGPFALIALVIIYQAAGQIAAANSASGFTTQFDPISHIPNDHDADLIAFLEDHNLDNGYTNYWVAFRIAFLSGERLQYSSALPYKADLSYNAADNRYPPYRDATEQASQVAFITTNLTELDIRLETAFAAQGITYQQTRIGLFHIYYDFQPHKPTYDATTSPS